MCHFTNKSIYAVMARLNRFFVAKTPLETIYVHNLPIHSYIAAMRLKDGRVTAVAVHLEKWANGEIFWDLTPETYGCRGKLCPKSILDLLSPTPPNGVAWLWREFSKGSIPLKVCFPFRYLPETGMSAVRWDVERMRQWVDERIATLKARKEW